MEDTIIPLDLWRMFVGSEPALFYLEIVARTLIIYVYTLVLLRWIGSRAISQLSTVEFLLVIALGSAVGDALFYPEVPLLHAMLAITVVVLINKAIDVTIYRSDLMKSVIDGSAEEVVRGGRVSHQSLMGRNMAIRELHEMLRLKGVRNLGEVEFAYMEPGGKMSVFTKEQDYPGLPLVPYLPSAGPEHSITAAQMLPDHHYACGHCGETGCPPPMTGEGDCANCGHGQWIRATIGAASPADATPPKGR